MPHPIIHKAVINLLLLTMAMQSVLAFGQTAVETTEPPSRAHQMAIMDCCDTGLHGNTGHSEQYMVCGDMASVDCTLATSMGSCGAMLSALVSEKDNMPAQSSCPTRLHPHDGYLSIILDTLTPPPNSSKA